jgi:hypothetical protein
MLVPRCERSLIPTAGRLLASYSRASANEELAPSGRGFLPGASGKACFLHLLFRQPQIL